MNKEDHKIAYENVMIANKMLEQENKQLNSILTDLEEWLNENLQYWKKERSWKSYHIQESIERTKEQIQKLKEEYKC